MASSAEVNKDLPTQIPKIDAPQLDYNVVSYAHSLPRTIRILKEDGKTTDTITNNDLEMKFKIPAGTYNLSRSILRYTWVPAAAPGTADRYIWAHADLLPIRQIRLATQEGGVIMTDLMYADHYSRIIPKAETPLNQFLTQDSMDSIYPCNELAAANFMGPTNTSGVVNYLETKYYRIGGNNANIAPETKSIELSTFKNTLLDLDKMVHYPEPLELTIWFRPRSHWYFLSEDANDAKDSHDATQNINLSNIELYMRQESDPTIDAECKNAVLNAPVEQPFTLYTPVVTARSMIATSGPNSSIQLQLGTGMGTRLTKVYAIPQNSNESKNTLYDSNNESKAKVSRYQTKFNALNVQPNAISVDSREDWFQVKHLLKGSAIMNSKIYERNWFILDDYSGITEETKSIFPMGKNNLVCGRKLQLGDVFELVTDNTSALNWYIFFVGQRVLRIAPLSKGGIGYI